MRHKIFSIKISSSPNRRKKMEKVDLNRLRDFDALKDVPDVQLSWLLDKCDHLMLHDGQELSVPGELFSGTHFIMSGRCRVYTIQNGYKREIRIINTGEITGYLPYSKDRMATASVYAVGTVQVMCIPLARINEMIATNFELTQSLVEVLSSRVKYVTSFHHQDEKMMALGKLSAGMTHELNNPASAMLGDSSFLIRMLNNLPVAFFDLMRSEVEVSEILATLAFISNAARGNDDIELNLRARKAHENEILGWLNEQKVENSDMLCETFIEFKLTAEDFNVLAGELNEKNISRMLNWAHQLFEMISVAKNISESSRRIVALIGSVKTYTHMDRGLDSQPTDVHAGIKNTLTMLNHKIKERNITVEEVFDLDLPKIDALSGELNQVWTNLIDNALDSMKENHLGTLKILTLRDREFVRVSFIDNGPGIPEELIPMVFDPFFTTKNVGEGTGIGLDLVRKIVNRHKGSIKLFSKSGHTEFAVCLPIKTNF